MLKYQIDIKNCVETLKSGGIILYPTDTVWGIGCDATNSKAVQKIFGIKKREYSKPMVVLLANETDVLKYTSIFPITIFDYLKNISKPTTVIYKSAKNLAANLLADNGSIAIRIIKEEFCKALIDEFGKPIVATSANISGYPTPSIFTDIDIAIKSRVDYIVQYRQDELLASSPSAIIEILENGEIKILRS